MATADTDPEEETGAEPSPDAPDPEGPASAPDPVSGDDPPPEGSASAPDAPAAEAPAPAVPLSSLATRSALGGTLMGLANLVPGISGGTMLLAAGIYPRFIEAVAEVSTLKLRKASLVVLGVVITCAATVILLLAGPVKTLVVEHRWAMYSLFIGLTLGGVPVVWQMARSASRDLLAGAAVGFALMAFIAYNQLTGEESTVAREGFVLMFVAGVAGASAMILPGISGGYLLLLMGVYVPILGAIDAFKEAMKAGDTHAAMDPATSVILPVGVGVVLGVLVVSNLLKLLLHRFEKATLGGLLGLLIGAVLGLWPFQQGVRPEVGDVFRGQVMTEALLRDLPPEKWPTEFFTPGAGQVVGALALAAGGFVLTALIARLGRGSSGADEPRTAA